MPLPHGPRVALFAFGLAHGLTTWCGPDAGDRVQAMVQGSEWTAHHPTDRGVTRRRTGDAWLTGESSVRPSIDDDTTKLAMAHRMADGLMPFSPAWDAAMAWVDELEASLAEKASALTGG